MGILKKLSFSLAVLVLSVLPAAAQGTKYRDLIQNQTGVPIPNVTVKVCSANSVGTPCAPAALIYTNSALTTPKANPFVANTDGTYEFYVAPGRYDFQYSGTGLSTQTLTNNVVPCDVSQVQSGCNSVVTFLNSTQSGQASAIQIGPAWYSGTASTLATPPAVAPLVQLESATGGSITAQDLYCVDTYGNRLGQTTQSPVSTKLTVGGATNQLKVSTNNDLNFLTGGYKMRTYCGNNAGGPFTKMVPKTIKYTASNNGLSRTSNVDTVVFGSATGLARNQQITISGDAGCGTSFAGTYRISTVSADSKTFTFPQTAGNDASCGGAAIIVSYQLAIDTDWAWAVAGGGFEVIYDTNPDGVNNPPVSNTATISSLQVAVNAARGGTPGTSHIGYVILQGTIALTTPLILGDFDTIYGTCSQVNPDGGCTTGGTGSIVTSNWSDVNTGTVMVMGPGVYVKNVSFVALAGDTNPLMILPGTSNFNGTVFDGDVFQALGSSQVSCAVKIFRVTSMFQSQFTNSTGWGGRGVLCASNSSIAPVTWSYGRFNSGSTAGLSQELIGDGGPTDWARGVNFGGFPSDVAFKIVGTVDGESNRTTAIDIVNNGGLELDGYTNSDATGIPANTIASAINLTKDSFGTSPGPLTIKGFTKLAGTANATTTINIANNSVSVLNCQGVAQISASASSALQLVAGSAQTYVLDNCGFNLADVSGLSLGADYGTFRLFPHGQTGTLAGTIGAISGPQKLLESNSPNATCQSTASNIWTLFNGDCSTVRATVDSTGNLIPNKTAGVVNATAYSGADICAQVTTAKAALGASGGTIYIPAGVYSACAASLPSITTSGNQNFVIQGAGMNSTVIQFATGINGILIGSASASPDRAVGVKLRDLTLVGFGAGQSTIGITLDNASETDIQNVQVNTFGTGVAGKGQIERLIMKHNRITSNGVNGSFGLADGTNTNTYLQKSTFENNNWDGATNDCFDLDSKGSAPSANFNNTFILEHGANCGHNGWNLLGLQTSTIIDFTPEHDGQSAANTFFDLILGASTGGVVFQSSANQLIGGFYCSNTPQANCISITGTPQGNVFYGPAFNTQPFNTQPITSTESDLHIYEPRCSFCTAGSGGLVSGTAPTVYIPTSGGQQINGVYASGAQALGTAQINATTCAAAVNISVTNMLATDRVSLTFNAAPGGAYLTGLIILPPDVTAGSFNIRVCNPTAGNLTPPAATLNWSVTR